MCNDAWREDGRPAAVGQGRRVRPHRDGDVRRRGGLLIWVAVLVGVLAAVGALAVDFGGGVLANARLQNALDSAALYGAGGLGHGPRVARNRTIRALLDHKTRDIDLDTVEWAILLGHWRGGRFVELPRDREHQADTLRVEVRLPVEEVTGWRALLGFVGDGHRVAGSATATRGGGDERAVEVDARAAIVLADAPEGAVVPYTLYGWQPGPDHPMRKATLPSKNHSAEPGDLPDPRADLHDRFAEADPADPGLVGKRWSSSSHRPLDTGLDLSPGQRVRFDNVRGTSGDYQSGMETTGARFGPDGSTWRVYTQQADGHGHKAPVAPLNALMGVFLPREGESYPEPPRLDFATAASKDYATLEPQVGQVFFIGDGKRADGSLQTVIAPDQADRLFLGVQDDAGFWWDNFGSYRLTVTAGAGDDRVVLVD